MNLSIEVNDKELTEIVEKGIKNLSSETINEIAKKAISEFFSKKEVMEALAFQKVGYGSFGTYTDYDRPREWLLGIIKSSFSEDELKEYRQKLLKTIDEERDQIILKAITRAFADALVTEDFKKQLYNAMYR